MTWIVIALVVALVFVIATSARAATPVAVDTDALGTSGEIAAIEYFWRPG